MITIHTEPGHRVLCGSSLAEHDLPAGLQVDALITDPPYSERTHAGHDQIEGIGDRCGIDYRAWDDQTVALAVELWAPRTRGWIVIITDHALGPAWERELDRAGRYVFSPLPFVSPGSRVRLSGDGPSCWHCWIVVARPRTMPWSKWGTLPGAYTFKPERNMPVVGGKPLSLMRALVSDYSREGETVWDPCCGGGTTLVAAKETGRKSIGMDLDRAHCEISAQRLKDARQTTMKFPARPAGDQGVLL